MTDTDYWRYLAAPSGAVHIGKSTHHSLFLGRTRSLQRHYRDNVASVSIP